VQDDHIVFPLRLCVGAIIPNSPRAASHRRWGIRVVVQVRVDSICGYNAKLQFRQLAGLFSFNKTWT